MICDEPVSALDVSIQAQVINLLEDLQDKFGLTYLFIAHDLSVVEHISTRVAVMYLGRVVEIAPSRDLYEKPLHPYTRGLMASIPRLDQPAGKRLVPIRGQPPNLSQLPPGCSFNPRCAEAVDRCRSEAPALMRASDGHPHACWVAPHV